MFTVQFEFEHNFWVVNLKLKELNTQAFEKSFSKKVEKSRYQKVILISEIF